MSDNPNGAALAALYPSTVKPDAGAAATMAPKTAATAPAPAAPPPAVKPSPGTWTAPDGAPPAKAAQPDPPASPAETIYDAALGAGELAEVVKLPDDPEAAGFGVTPEAKAERQAFRDALAGEGVNRIEAQTIWQHAIASAAPGYVAPDYDAAERDLRAEWGSDFDANLSRARKAVQRIVAKVPGVKRHLLETGAHNDPALVKMLARMERKRGR